MYGESLIHSFLPLGVISSVKSPNKKKNYCPENEMCVCVWQMSFSAIFVLNKITVSVFQIIHIRNKALNPCINGGLERRGKVQTHFQGLSTF